MIIVVAALGFESEEKRDRAVELTRDVQLATREEEEDVMIIALPRPINSYKDSGL